MEENIKKEISKICMNEVQYNIKDEELRERIRRFRGDLDRETKERKSKDGLESNN